MEATCRKFPLMHYASCPTEPATFDPYNFPNYTIGTVRRDISALLFGVVFYEMVMCLKAYFAIFSAERMKAVIFKLITVAVVSLITTSLLLPYYQFDMSKDYLLTQRPGEFEIVLLSILSVVICKIGYYTAATLRTRALLTANPKILKSFYIGLIVSNLGNIAMLGLFINYSTVAYNPDPSDTDRILRLIPDASFLRDCSIAFTTLFDMIFANALIVSFLYPIFKTLEMKPILAVREMIKAGDVQKALFSSAASLVLVFLTFYGDTTVSVTIPMCLVWLHAQNTQFMLLSYVTPSKLLTNLPLVEVNQSSKAILSKSRSNRSLPQY